VAAGGLSLFRTTIEPGRTSLGRHRERTVLVVAVRERRLVYRDVAIRDDVGRDAGPSKDCQPATKPSAKRF
jgi:hypothetical protein